MKSLVFNLLVVGALGFLLFDGNPPTSIRGAVDKVAATADQLVDKGRALVDKPAPRPRAKPVPRVTPKPEPVVVTTPVTATPVEQAPPPARPSKVAAAPAPKLDPAVARRRAEVLGELPDSAAMAPKVAPRFMAPRVRRTELNKLAEDMELLFVENVVR